jgi:hypothetical protein
VQEGLAAGRVGGWARAGRSGVVRLAGRGLLGWELSTSAGTQKRCLTSGTSNRAWDVPEDTHTLGP